MLPELAMASKSVERPEGQIRIWTRPGKVFTQCAGRMLLPHAEAVMAAIDEAIRERPGQVVAIHDLMHVESYEINVHTRMTAWSVSTFRDVRRVVIGVRSPLVSLAVRTVNLAVGGRYEVLDTEEALWAVARRELAYGTPDAQPR
jgi:hypothetical protein